MREDVEGEKPSGHSGVGDIFRCIVKARCTVMRFHCYVLFDGQRFMLGQK